MVGAEIVGPVRIEAGAQVHGGRIGPNVTIEANANLVGSVLSNSLVGAGSQLEDVRLTDSLLGDRTRLRGIQGTVNLASDSVVEAG